MKAKRRKRPLINKFKDNPDKALLKKTSIKVSYIGSPEHKDVQNKITGFARPRADASICPQDLSEKPSTVCRWLKNAIEKGCVSELWEGGYPRYVWFYDKKEDRAFMGRLVNRELGQYKGWPIEQWEWPEGIKDRYA